MWTADQVEFMEVSIRGSKYDLTVLGAYSIAPPNREAPYWEIEFADGSTIVTTDVVTLIFGKRKETI
jgi:hypothetical protein